jgi:hypothetical protein
MRDSPSPQPIEFDPAPHAGRHDGWTPERQRGFVAALARIGVVAAAAKAVGKSAKSAYALRKRPGAVGFAAAWDRALAIGRDEAGALAIDRAIHGVAEPVFYGGRQIGVRHVYDHRLLGAAIRALGPRLADWSPDRDW